MRFEFVRFALGMLIPVMLGSCGIQQNVDDAIVEISVFHADLDSGHFEDIWTDADKDFQKATPKPEMVKLLGAIHKKLGKVRQSEKIGWNANATTNGTFVTVAMDTKFEKGTGREQFIYRKTGGLLKLVGYNINSEDMLMN